MFTVHSSHGRALYSPFLLIHRRLFSARGRPSTTAPSTVPIKPILQPHGPVAEQLAATGLWDRILRTSRAKAADASTKIRSPKKASKPVGDKSRVNVVSDKLCDDILSYIGPSLERHRGCDVIDLFPGAGLWSSKLHQFLEPRSHLLLEPDAELYKPFLQPLLDQPGTTLIPKSGIIWRELNSVLTPEFLPHQTIPDDITARNDTLLVTANLCLHPKKRFLRFDSIARLVLHQFIDAPRTGTLFQRYGLVRMLIWATPEDMASFLPRTIQKRRRQAIECDFTLEWMQEVCGKELASEYYIRDEAIDQASLAATIERMRAANLEMPAGRESAAFLEALKREEVPVPGMQPPTMTRRYHNVLADLVATTAEQGGLNKDSQEFKTMRLYGWRATTDVRKGERFHNLTQGLDKILALYASGKATAEEIAAAEFAWQREVRELPKTLAFEFSTYKDNLPKSSSPR
ncbi:hypothetical protein NPX13_g10040 [Xylaria arbuscula]|uniref:rRNA adenine N(6)-methyltransferase n=1 Tax=Xylaria arbuscula TaxID=114810 RepID=A0A9W8TH60_9PEZI|nr:hypothetical protein NPX13_g10040 [Xylaria arbuscula]